MYTWWIIVDGMDIGPLLSEEQVFRIMKRASIKGIPYTVFQDTDFEKELEAEAGYSGEYYDDNPQLFNEKGEQ